ncbi:MAG: sigma-70 family RNA polymerase sigma factor [Mycobacterium sp.]
MDISEAGAIRMLYDEHAAALWRYVLSLTHDRVRAEDVVQETLLRACQHLEVVDDTARSPRAWLFTVARNMIIDESRSARFRSEASARDPSTFEQAGPDESGSTVDRMLMGDAMAQLSTEHRAVVRRSYYQGWTTAQIAADLAIAEGTVKSRLHYALRALRQALQEMGVAQ